MTSDSLVWHDNPVETSEFFVRADLSPHGMPGRSELFWVKKEGDRLFRICCVPFFTCEIALGDIVETDDEFTFLRVVSRSGHKVFRIAVANKSNEAHLHSVLHDWVEQTGLLYEFYSDGYLSVDLPPEVSDAHNMQLIDELEQNGEIAIELVE